MVDYLLKNKVINDPSDVALLMRSVAYKNSKPFIEALAEKGIKSFCPRAKAYFEKDEIKILIACFAIILDFIGDDLKNYQYQEHVAQGLQLLYKHSASPLIPYIKETHDRIAALKGDESIDEIPSDIPYRLFAYPPFKDFLKDENLARSLSQFSALMASFMTYYHMTAITAKSKIALKYRLFNSFFAYMLREGQNEYESDTDPIPKGHVQIMTIHQSKGLEFPVVVVGSLDNNPRTNKQVDNYLSPFYKRPAFEPVKRITEFDHSRLFYVAFSRPQKLLVLTSSDTPVPRFGSVWQGLDQWPYVKRDTLKAQRFKSKEPYVPKKTLSLTSHINVYDTCPRQYQFYKEYEFTPSRTGQMLFGTLVHETIEDIHRRTLDKEKVDEIVIANDFETNYKGLLASGHRPLAEKPKDAALAQVINYFRSNKDILSRVIETEVDVSYEKDDYIINGKIDLLMGNDDKLEILDFKSQSKPDSTDPVILKYKYQLHIYAHILNERYKKTPERLYLYWTAEKDRKNALMEIPYDEHLLEEAGRHFDDTAQCIIKRDWTIRNMPNKRKICDDCDFLYYCGLTK
jgi:DNA helicase-2/ATP-dependent DNA helicase PcrA